LFDKRSYAGTVNNSDWQSTLYGWRMDIMASLTVLPGKISVVVIHLSGFTRCTTVIVLTGHRYIRCHWRI